MKVGFAELGKKFILSNYPRKIWADITIQKKNILENLVRTENPKISSKDLVRTENLKGILKRFGIGQKIQKLSSKDLGLDKWSKSYPRKIWGWTKDPKLTSKEFGVDKEPKVNLERV